MKVVYITKSLSDGSIRKPMEYDETKFNERRTALMQDGWRLATPTEIGRFYNIEEQEAKPVKKKTTEKKAEDK